MVLTYISLMCNDVEHFCHLCTFINKYQIFIMLFVFLLLSCENVLYILKSSMCFANIFSSLYLAVSFLSAFGEAKILNL